MEEALLNKIYNNHKIIKFVEMLIGTLLTSIGFNLFILPLNIVTGGVSGISIIIHKYVIINPFIVILILNIIIFLLSLIFIGYGKSKRSLIGSILYPIFVYLTSGLYKYLNMQMNDKLLFVLFGGVVIGIGLGLVYKADYTTGGTDIIAQIISKYFKVTMGKALFFVDGIIILVGGYVFGITNLLYALLVIGIITYLTDKVMIGISDSKAFYIVTSKEDEVSSFVLNDLHHSVTVLDAKGGFMNKKNPVLFTVIPTKEYYKFKEGLKLIDKDAFFTVIDAYEVLGGE